MYFEKLIFTSDRDFSREVCGDFANYFDPFSSIEIVDLFKKVLENPVEANSKKTFYKQQIEKLNVLDSNFNNDIIYNTI